VLTCGFASHHASCTVGQHSNSTIPEAQDWMAWALWVAVVSARLAASDRDCIRTRALRLSALLSFDDYGWSVERAAHGQVLWRVQIRAAERLLGPALSAITENRGR
jgi:hypothetical protein